MANPSKAQLITRAKALGLKVGDDWTHRQIRDAIIIAETEAEIAQEDTDERLGDFTASSDPVIPEPPDPKPLASLPVAPEPTPIVAPAPPSIPMDAVAPKVLHDASSYDPSHPRIGAGRYHVLWTVTLPGGAVDGGKVVDLNDAQARSLVMQGAVVHVDDYEAYIRHNAGTKAVKVETHPAKIPSGAGRYRTIGGVMKNGKEIPHGTVAEFTAEEVASLTKPGMIAIEFAD